MKSLSKLCLVFGVFLAMSNAVFAQSSLKDDEAKKAGEVSRLVNSKTYTFVVEKIASQKTADSTISRYDLDVSKDTIIAYLPGISGSPASNSTEPDNTGITYTHFYYDMKV